MLAAANSVQRKAEDAKKKEFMTKTTVDKDAGKKVLASTATVIAGTLDPKSLTPATPKAKFTNPLRMDFLPVDDLKGVLVGATEVTVAQIEFWTKATGRDAILQSRTNDTPAHPVVNVSWDAAVAFCAWLTEQDRTNKLIPANARYRLPQDLEWSLAAGLKNETGADPAQRHLKEETQFPWGTDWPPRPMSANIDAPNVPGYSDSFSYTAPVGSMRANAFGLHDLGGNVSEWCEDPWPGSDDEHVIRGGSWIVSAKEALLTSARQHFRTGKFRADLGFRCVLDLGK
jgi:formylglycine-generating enzyme required for sulfatase activity